MPIREYGCEACRLTQERLEGVNCTTEAPRCEKCGETMKRIEVSATYFRCYGNGFFNPHQR